MGYVFLVCPKMCETNAALVKWCIAFGALVFMTLLMEEFCTFWYPQFFDVTTLSTFTLNVIVRIAKSQCYLVCVHSFYVFFQVFFIRLEWFTTIATLINLMKAWGVACANGVHTVGWAWVMAIKSTFIAFVRKGLNCAGHDWQRRMYGCVVCDTMIGREVISWSSDMGGGCSMDLKKCLLSPNTLCNFSFHSLWFTYVHHDMYRDACSRS